MVIITSPADGLITNQSPIMLNWLVGEDNFSESVTLSEGINVLTKEAIDDAGNVGSDSVTVILDTTKPVITLTGSDTINLFIGDTYEEFGATAEDNVSEEITIDSSDVDTSVADTYEVTYNVSDEAGNVADEVIRTVIVSEVPADTTPPNAITFSEITDISNHTLKLNWTATGDDGNTGTASSYDIRYAKETITDDNWDDTAITTQISSPSAPTPTEAGTTQSVEVNGLNQGTTYYFAMKVSDEVPNESGLSNVISATTKTPPPQSSGGGGGSYTPPTSQTANNVPLKISSSQKGTLNQDLNNKNKVKVEVPKGSIKTATTFTASKGSLKEEDIPKDKVGAFLFNGLAFNINAVDSSKKAVKEFSEDLTITLTVPDLPDDTASLELYYYDEEKEEWIIITDIEFGDGAITFKVNHLTQFALFETNAAKAGEVKGTTTANILDGDIIQCQSSGNPFAVYIVKIVGDTKYIRHIVSLEIFNYYGHLKWENLKQVESLGEYSLSGWVRYNTGANYTAAPTDKVYEINGDQTRHWINMTAEQFLSHGGSGPAIFNINQGELNLYTAGVDVMSL